MRCEILHSSSASSSEFRCPSCGTQITVMAPAKSLDEVECSACNDSLCVVIRNDVRLVISKPVSVASVLAGAGFSKSDRDLYFDADDMFLFI